MTPPFTGNLQKHLFLRQDKSWRKVYSLNSESIFNLMDASPTDMYSQDDTATIPFWMRGTDVSSLQRSLDLGALFFDVDGSQAHPLDILKAHGVNFIRLRVWVNPAHGYNDKTKLLQFAPEVKARGMKLFVDFHYSDTWADPAHQLKPAAWADHDLVQLQGDIYAHTFDVCASLKSLGAPPDMVQIGNEINPGMLLPEGSIDSWENLAALLKQGWNAVKACSPSIQVMLHIADAGDSSGARAWFENARQQALNSLPLSIFRNLLQGNNIL